MHIPDSAISPTTSLAAGAAMLPVWAVASQRLHADLSTRQVPLLAIGAAFCFTIMMFNIPVPGGTTVHPVGAVLLAVLLGPWAAIVGVTVALAIQALFFADGGVLALGANSFTMAFAMPVLGYAVYRLVAGRAAANSHRRPLAAALGAYAGVNAAALLTAVILGIQPALFHQTDGRALYFPFGLGVTIPAILLSHLTLAGAAEAAVTAAVVRYLQAAGLPLYGAGEHAAADQPRREGLWVGLAALAALTPLGLLARGEAWGEWDAGEIARRSGYLPRGLGNVDTHGWKGLNLLPDYLGARGPLFYVLAAMAGIALVVGALYLAGRLLARRETEAAPPLPESANGPGQLPAWLAETGDSGAELAAALSPRRTAGTGRRSYLDRTLASLAEAARETVFAERWARQDGLLQRLDPRAKTAGLLGFVVLASCMHRPGLLFGLLAMSLALAALSRMPAGVLLRRVWLTVPLFVGAVTLPSALSVVTPGPALLVLNRAPYLAITAPGLAACGLLTLRVGVAVTFVILLTLTTRWHDLLRGLQALCVPKVFLAVLAMTYRYLAVLAQAASDMFTARKSRTLGRPARGEDRRFLGSAAGALFGKSLALTDEVHAAMLSRGWTGEARALRPLRLTRTDYAWLAAVILLAALAVGGGFFG